MRPAVRPARAGGNIQRCWRKPDMRRTLRIGLVALALQPAVAWEASAKPVRWSGNGHLYEVRVAPEPDGISWVLYRSTVVRHRSALTRPWVAGRSDRRGPE